MLTRKWNIFCIWSVERLCILWIKSVGFYSYRNIPRHSGPGPPFLGWLWSNHHSHQKRPPYRSRRKCPPACYPTPSPSSLTCLKLYEKLRVNNSNYFTSKKAETRKITAKKEVSTWNFQLNCLEKVNARQSKGLYAQWKGRLFKGTLR